MSSVGRGETCLALSHLLRSDVRKGTEHVHIPAHFDAVCVDADLLKQRPDVELARHHPYGPRDCPGLRYDLVGGHGQEDATARCYVTHTADDGLPCGL
jgi:hypothetical protein